jgi:hypothetical protein
MNKNEKKKTILGKKSKNKMKKKWKEKHVGES